MNYELIYEPGMVHNESVGFSAFQIEVPVIIYPE